MNLLIAAKLIAALVTTTYEVPRVNDVLISVTPTVGRLKFSVSWTTQTNVYGSPDSVTLYVRTPNTLSGTPYRVGIPHPTLYHQFYIPLPNDSVTFTVEVVAHRRLLSSTPTTATYFFNPDASVLIARLILKPDSAVVDTSGTVQFCAFLQYNDSTVVIRQQDQGTPACAQFYTTQFTAVQRQPNTYQQTKADRVCILWEATGGTIGQESCGVSANNDTDKIPVFRVKLLSLKSP